MKPVRRVVTGFNAAGKSCVISDGDAPQTPASINLWSTAPNDPLGSDPGTENLSLELPAGGSSWRIVDVPPYTVLKEYLKHGLPGHDKDGFHCTDTVDYVIVASGDITLVLDDGEVLLHAGDCVVQRRTNHVWRNDGDQPVRIICAIVSARH